MNATLVSDQIISGVQSLQCASINSKLYVLHDSVISTLENINFKLVEKFDAFLSHGNAVTSHYPLTDPFTHFLISYGYLVLFIAGLLVVRVLPLNKLRTLVSPFHFIFSFSMAIFSLWIFAETYFQAFVANDFVYVGNAVSTVGKHLPIAKVLWVFYFSKALQLLDTVFLIIKGQKYRLNLIHAYEHLSMFSVFWIVVYFSPGGDAVYPVIAYSGLTALNYFQTAGRNIGVRFGPLKSLLLLANIATYLAIVLHFITILVLGNKELPCLTKWILLFQAISLVFLYTYRLLRRLRNRICNSRCHFAKKN